MSTLSLDPDEFRTLEALRHRLATLTANLRSLQDTVVRSNNPLPPPASLQASARIAQQNLSSLQTLLSDRRDLFARLAVHPSTNFPGREHEMVLQGILRKKLEPEVEGWVERCREVAVGSGAVAVADADGAGKVGDGKAGRGRNERRARRGDNRGGGEDDDEGEDDEDEEDEEGYRPEDEDENAGGDPLTYLWADVRDSLLGRLRGFIEGESQDVYTAAEREMGVETVRTGLKRDLEEEMDDEEDEEDSEDEDGEGDGKDGGEDGDEEDEDVVMLGPGGAPVGESERPPQQQQQQQQKQQGPSMQGEHVLWFGARGDFAVPGHIETEATRKARAGGPAGRRPGR